MDSSSSLSFSLSLQGVYAMIGARKLLPQGKRMCKDLHKDIKLEVDGRKIDLPPIEGIVILNIMSWGSGANIWGPEKDEKFTKPNHWDGMLEVVGVQGVVHLGQIQSGLRSAIRIVQGSHIKIHINSEIPVQVDGEPWIQPAGDIVVLRSALKVINVHSQRTYSVLGIGIQTHDFLINIKIVQWFP